MKGNYFFIIWLGFLAMLLLPFSKNAQIKAQDTSLQKTELQEFFDTLVPKEMKNRHVSGMVIIIMDADSLIFSKGYGYANVEKQVSATPDKTVWRVASIAKVVTATAVMQLVEKGKANLDTDINTYLKGIQIPEKFGKPITLRHLLTHTAGFDDRFLNKSFRTAEARPSLKAFIKEVLPERIYPPGEVYTYSNVGNALAGLVVQDITGTDFAAYCKTHIFEPLNMKHSSFRLNEELKQNLYTSYVHQDSSYKEVPFDYLGDYPAGQLLSPATEFVRFMQAHLNKGIFDGTRILSEKLTKAMHSTQFTHHPKLNGSTGYAFHIGEHNGHKVVNHAGGYVGLATRMELFPNDSIGVFMAANAGSTGIMGAVVDSFVQTFFPPDAENQTDYPLENLPEYDKKVDKFTGYYRGTRYTHNDFTKAFLLAGINSEVHIRKNEQGMLKMYDLQGKERRLIQTEPNIFRSIDDDYYMAFKTAENGEPQFLFTHGTGALEKIPAFFEHSKQLTVISGILLLFLLVLLVRLFARIFRKKKPQQELKTMRILACTTAGVSLLHWILMGIVLFVLTPAWEVFQTGLSYGMPSSMYAVQVLPFIALIALVLLIYQWIRQLNNRHINWLSKAFYVLFILVGVLYTWMLNYWNLMGFKFG